MCIYVIIIVHFEKLVTHIKNLSLKTAVSFTITKSTYNSPIFCGLCTQRVQMKKNYVNCQIVSVENPERFSGVFVERSKTYETKFEQAKTAV